jgi:peptide/nickel transport system substrate-binding protein
MIGNRKLYLSLIMLLAFLLVAGCSVAKKSQEASGSQTEQKANQVLTVDLGSEPATLDPGLQYNTDSYSVYRNIFDNLLRRDPETLKIEPWVAESWNQDSDTTWSFKIRKDIKFHNGDPLTAKDVAFSIGRILDKSFSSPQYANFSIISSAKATSDDTVIITTNSQAPTLLTQLVNLSIVPEKYVKEKGNDQFNLNPIGSGAYQLVEWKKGNQISLKAVSNYWGDKVDISDVVFRFVPNAASRIADLQSGKANVVFNISSDDVDTIKNNTKLQVLSAPTERVAYLAINTLGDTATKDKKVRQAIAYGINSKSMIDSLLNGNGSLVKEVLTPLSFGYDAGVKGYSYDPEKAKELLKEAGYSDGVSIDFATSPTYDQRIVQAVQGDLDKIGIKVNIISTDQATYLKKVQGTEKNWGSLRMGIWSCACLDADGTIYPLFHSESAWSGYKNKDFDKIVEAARATTNEQDRINDYKEALNILQEDVPGIGLWQTHALYGATKKVHWKPDAQESFYLRDMKWAK